MDERQKTADNPFGAVQRRILIAVGLIGGRALLVLLFALGTLEPTRVDATTPSDTTREKYQRAAAETMTAVTQAIVYARDKGVYPTSLEVLRSSGYAAVPDRDPWGNDYVLSPILPGRSKPQAGDDVYVYSRGSRGTGTYPKPFVSTTGKGGSVGYSSLHGSWTGEAPWYEGLLPIPDIVSATYTAAFLGGLVVLVSALGRLIRALKKDDPGSVGRRPAGEGRLQAGPILKAATRPSHRLTRIGLLLLTLFLILVLILLADIF